MVSVWSAASLGRKKVQGWLRICLAGGTLYHGWGKEGELPVPPLAEAMASCLAAG